MLDYLVVYDSETGNTKKIATEIFASLPGMSKDLINLHERTDFPEAKIYFVGFCVHRGPSPFSANFQSFFRRGLLLFVFETVPESRTCFQIRKEPLPSI